jgi:transcriptional regulator with XRE-family HTH domain
MQDIDFVMLGNRLAAARRYRGIRQYALAQQTGIHTVTLSRIEHGNLPGMTVAVLARLAMALEVSIDELLGWQPTSAVMSQGKPTRQPRRQRTRKAAVV